MLTTTASDFDGQRRTGGAMPIQVAMVADSFGRTLQARDHWCSRDGSIWEDSKKGCYGRDRNVW